ncbi:MAG: hypothetical protein ACR2O6_13285 [Ilumatobacteraceae bacterium]
MAFVNKQGGEERRNELAGAGEMVDFDPHDESVVKVHYDLAAWTFDQRAELAEALAEALIPHAWDGEELLVPESVEGAVDELFDVLERELGPFPILLEEGAPSTEFGLDEWPAADRTLLTEALVDSEIPHRWEGTTVVVAADAEESVDELLDAIESGDMLSADTAPGHDPPEGVLSTVFLAASSLVKDPYDAGARSTLVELGPLLDPKRPPFAFAPRTWSLTVDGVDEIAEQVTAEAKGADAAGGDSAAAVSASAERLKTLLRPFV